MAILPGLLQGKRVLVTGATGFIGGRLAQRLAMEEGAMVTGVGRKLEAVPFLQEAGVTMRRLDLRSAMAIEEVTAGQEVIFHLAATGTGDLARARRLNVEVTEELVRQAAVAGVSRFVHVSTIAAYGPPDRLLMDESHPVDPQQSSTYGRTKAEGELRAFQVAAEVGLPLTVIRPGMVYGPRSPGWTVRMLKLVQSRTPVVFGEGDGHAHPVFIDNLVDGLLLAATRPEAIGQAFNFVDAAITWRAFFDYYGAMAGRKSVRLPLWLARVGLAVYKLVSGRQESGQELLNYYTMKAVYPTGKAEQLLGYRPRVSLAEGMALAERWLREQGYL